MLKAFFLLLLLVFGATMFAAGALAPASVKEPLEHIAAEIAARFPGDASKAAGSSTALSTTLPSTSRPAAASAASGAIASSIGAAPAAASGSLYAASTPIANLLVPVPPPAKGHYALQVATFTSSDAAALFANSVSEQGYKTTIVPISDSGQPLIVTIGDYPSAQAASDDQLAVGRDLKSTALPPVVLLPPPPPPAH
ncbi:SPOR domain-containing protein [Caballeronia sp. SEWSISQ10-4 2]|uniref:SPOR domain-containing protein n=1 Tax=Caballeronia sp. SEWSISQ10-4 2 TaxID=2937438 RepID=UPI002656BC4C|nr:SPOR domain-containing protein [Caballeronia sp. SEWSISQ10-4 2]MDN7183262.1 SPOR domain-containing protein [Caballeronia sp. SEWSISQ10-4 2]